MFETLMMVDLDEVFVRRCVHAIFYNQSQYCELN